MSCADLNCQSMIQGQVYTFFFKYGGWLGLNIDANAAANQLSKDSQFKNVVGSQANCNCFFKQTSIALSFKWNGSECIVVGQAGQTAQQDLANFWLTGIGTSLIFTNAKTGAVSACCDPNSNKIPWATYAILGAIVLVGVAYYMGWHETILARARGVVA